MYLTRIVIFLIFCSSFAPLAIILAVLYFDFQTGRINHPWVILPILVVALICSLFTRYALKAIRAQGGQAIRVVAVERSEKDTILYTLPYLAALISLDITNPSRLVAFLLFIVMISYFKIKGKSVFLNPILAEQGYEPYLLTFRPKGPGELGPERQVLALALERPKVDDDYQVFAVSDNAVIVTAHTQSS